MSEVILKQLKEVNYLFGFFFGYVVGLGDLSSLTKQ